MPTQTSTIASWQILLVILLEGFVTISVEILAIRQLIPVVGNNVIVTSLIIGVFLLFLSLGYRAGGRHNGAESITADLKIESQRAPSAHLFALLQRNFLIAAIGIGFGLSLVFVEIFFYLVNTKLHFHLLFTLTIYLFLVIAPIVYFLGQTVPITMNLYSLDLKELGRRQHDESPEHIQSYVRTTNRVENNPRTSKAMSISHRHQTVGKLGGKILYLSTIGSFLGSVLTTLLLMNFLGVAWTVMINFLILAGLALLCSQKRITYGLIFIFFGVLAFGINRNYELQQLITTTPYANYAVIHDVKREAGKTGTVLSVNGSASSFIDKDKHAFAYVERIKTILFKDLALKNKDVLVLGAGGFTLSAENTFGNRFTYVDIDPEIYDVVRQHFLSEIKGTFVAADARLYVKDHPNRYDVIISDAYSNRHAVPAHLLTREYFASVKQALRADGIAIFNVIGAPLINTRYTKRVDKTLRSVFGSCSASPLSFKRDAPTNIIYVCLKNSEEGDDTIYTDDVNKSSLDF